MKFIPDTRFDADVLVAGGGPAGGCCAYHLAKAGHSVLLIDFQRFPRDKVCGDFVGNKRQAKSTRGKHVISSLPE